MALCIFFLASAMGKDYHKKKKKAGSIKENWHLGASMELFQPIIKSAAQLLAMAP